MCVTSFTCASVSFVKAMPTLKYNVSFSRTAGHQGDHQLHLKAIITQLLPFFTYGTYPPKGRGLQPINDLQYHNSSSFKKP